MEKTKFRAAVWSYGWDAISEESPQGAAALEDDGVTLEIPFGRILGKPLIPLDDKAYPEAAERLFGISVDGKWMVARHAFLKRSWANSAGGTCQTVHARDLLVGRNRFDPDARVSVATAKYLGLRDWVGGGPIEARLATGPQAISTLTIRHGSDFNAGGTVYDGEDVRVSMERSFCFSPPSPEGAGIKTDCLLRIEFKSQAEIDTARDVALELGRFLSMCMGFDARLESLELRQCGCDSNIRLYFAHVRGEEPTSRQLHLMPVPYEGVKDGMSALLERWLTAGGEFGDAKGLVCSLMFKSWSLPVDLRLIAASQALEELTRIGANAYSRSAEEVERDKAEVTRSIADKELRRRILNGLSRNRKGQNRLLREFLVRRSDVADAVIGDTEAFVTAHTTLRNKYAHRTQLLLADKMEDYGERLHWHTECVLMLCYLTVMVLTGIAPEMAVSALRRLKGDEVAKVKSLYPGT